MKNEQPGNENKLIKGREISNTAVLTQTTYAWTDVLLCRAYTTLTWYKLRG